jgi:hypothetical protein
MNDVLVTGGRSSSVDPSTNGRFVPVIAKLESDGTFDLSYNGSSVFTNLTTGFIPETGDRFGFGARTGGFSQMHRIDNLSINAVATPEPETWAMMALGCIGLCVVGTNRKRRTSIFTASMTLL